MICTDCRARADKRKKPGCDRACGTHGCACQHKARGGPKLQNWNCCGASFPGPHLGVCPHG